MEFPPSINPRIYTIASFIIGYALIGDFSANEQRAIGNFFINIGQILTANGVFQQLVEERITSPDININSRKFKSGGSPFTDQAELNNFNNFQQSEYYKKLIHDLQENDILNLDILFDAIEKINQELEDLKNEK